jgi:hypothetical protein
VLGFLASLLIGTNGLAQDGPAAPDATPGAYDTLSIASLIAIVAVIIALWALFEVVRSRRLLNKLEESYFQKEYIKELGKSKDLINKMRQFFVPYAASRHTARGKRSAPEFGEIVSLRAELEELKKKIDPARKEPSSSDGKAKPAVDTGVVASAGVERIAAAQYPKQDAAALPMPPPPPPPLSIYYATVPERDGTFKWLKDRQDWDSLYKLRLVGDPATATSALVDICDNPEMFKTALGTPQLYLNPVCDYSCNPTSNASKIKVIRPGRVERRSPADRWKIVEDHKLQIEFT